MGLRTEFSLKVSICSAVSKVVSQERRRLDRETAVQTAPHAGKYHFEMSGFKI